MSEEEIHMQYPVHRILDGPLVVVDDDGDDDMLLDQEEGEVLHGITEASRHPSYESMPDLEVFEPEEAVHEVNLSDEDRTIIPEDPLPALSLICPSMIIENITDPEPGLTVRIIHTSKQTTPINWPNPGYDPSAPFTRFYNLPDEVRLEIMKLAIPSLSTQQACTVRPYYNQFSVQIAPPEDPGRCPNISTSDWLDVLNKKWCNDATVVLYSANRFEFSDPNVLKWWIKRIGPTNTKRVRCLGLDIRSGDVHDQRKVFGSMAVEKLWAQTLDWLQPLHQIQSLDLYFTKWRRQGIRAGDAQWLEIERYREEVVLALLRYRGLQEVYIERPTTWHIAGRWQGRSWNQHFWEELEEVMVMPKGQRSGLEVAFRAVVGQEHVWQGLGKGIGLRFTNSR